MVRRDAFARVPGEGRRVHVLVADGNVGIGGDPAMLLAQAAPLLSVGTRLVRSTRRPSGTGGGRSGCALRPVRLTGKVGAVGARRRSGDWRRRWV